jgi:multidrug efflux pump subunit AcrB
MLTPFRIFSIAVMIIILSLLSLKSLKINLLPNRIGAEITILYSLDGADPTQIENDVTNKLENYLSKTRGLKVIKSVSSHNSGHITMVFESDENIVLKKIEILNIVRQVRSSLPIQMPFPIIIESPANDEQVKAPMLKLAISGLFTLNELKAASELIIRKKLSKVQGIYTIKISQTPNPQLSIIYNLEKLKHYRIPIEGFAGTIGLATRISFPGKVQDTAGIIHLVKVKPAYSNINSLKNLVIKSDTTGHRITLDQVAMVSIDEQPISNYYRTDGFNTVMYEIYLDKKFNSVQTSNEIVSQIPSITKMLPGGFHVNVENDSIQALSLALNKNYNRMFVLCVTVLGCTLLLYRSYRHLMCIFSTLMITSALTILTAFFVQLNFNFYSIAGLSIAFGLIVDQTIVVVDSYNKFHSKGIFSAVIASTTITVLGLLTIFLLPDAISFMLADYVFIIIISLISSLIVNFWVTPLLSEVFALPSLKQKNGFLFLRKKAKFLALYLRLLSYLGSKKTCFLIFILLLFGIPTFQLPEKLENQPLYNTTIGSKFYQDKISPVIDTYLGGTYRLFKLNVVEHGLKKSQDKTQLFVNVELPFGYSFEQTKMIILKVEDFLKKFTGIKHFKTNLYSGRFANIVIDFEDQHSESNYPIYLKTQLASLASELDFVEWSIYGAGKGYDNAMYNQAPSFRILLKGANYDDLGQQAKILENRLKKYKRVSNINTNARFTDLDKESKEFSINVDRSKSILLKSSTVEIMTLLSTLSDQQHQVGSVFLANHSYPVVLRDENAELFSQWDIFNTNIATGRNNLKMKDFSSLDIQNIPGSIYKENRQYQRIFSFDYLGDYDFGKKIAKSELLDLSSKLPIGYSAQLENSVNDFGLDSNLYVLIIPLMFIIFTICGMLTENFYLPLCIIISLPVSSIGIFIVFYLFETTLDTGGYAAFVTVGVHTLNSCILLVHEVTTRTGKIRTNFNKMILKSIISKGHTIMVTIITAILGFIPFIIHDSYESFWYSLAIGSIGGLLCSIFTIFVAFPVTLWQKSN